ncbi:hypothetical protein AVEN_51591-1, partial [Araneus ventricosus]
LQPRIGGAEYVRWGQTSCSNAEAEPTVVGVLTTSEIIQDGGSSQFICSTLDPTQVDPKDYFKDYPGDDDPDMHLLVSPIRYVKTNTTRNIRILGGSAPCSLSLAKPRNCLRNYIWIALRSSNTKVL